MDPATKKRKSDENGAAAASMLTPEDAGKIIEPFTQEQLREIVRNAMLSSEPGGGVLDTVRSIADRDPTQRKLFIRGLGWDTTNDSLRAVFSAFGDLEEAVVIADKASGRSKGYGFITFRHFDGALLALKDPSKQIDGRMTVTNYASAGNTGPIPPNPAVDGSLRKIYVGNVPVDMPSDRLLAHFAAYGEIEEGPLGFDKQTGKFRGYALFVYKTVEAAKAALVDATKSIDGHHLTCRLANDGKKGKPVTFPPAAVPQGQQLASGAVIPTVNGLGIGTQSSFPGTQSSFPGSGLSSFGGYTGSTGLPGVGGLSHHHAQPSALQSSVGTGAPSLSSSASQVPSSLGPTGTGGYGGGLGGPYGSSSQYGGVGAGGYSANSTGGYASAGAAVYGGLGIGSSLYRMPPGSAGMPSGGYPESGQYLLSSSTYQSQHQPLLSSSAYQSQHQPPAGSSPGRRFPTGGAMYPNLPPYY